MHYSFKFYLFITFSLINLSIKFECAFCPMTANEDGCHLSVSFFGHSKSFITRFLSSFIYVLILSIICPKSVGFFSDGCSRRQPWKLQPPVPSHLWLQQLSHLLPDCSQILLSISWTSLDIGFVLHPNILMYLLRWPPK